MATQRTSPGVLSSEDSERFERDGYLVIDPEIPASVLEGVLEDVGGRYRPEGEVEFDELGVLNVPGARPRIMDAWKVSENVKRVALAPKVLAACEQLYGRAPLPFQTLNFPVGTEQPPHADAMHFDSDPPGYVCGVWLALEEVDVGNGTLVYFPGSHKLGLPSWDEIGRPEEEPYPRPDVDSNMPVRYARYDQYVQGVIERHGFEAEYATIPKGQALIWSANLLHGGSRQRDPGRTRHSQVTHCYFEGCRYWTPMRSEGAREFWRYPWWIREAGVRDELTAVRETVEAVVPAGASVLVMGDTKIDFDLGDRSARHFAVANDIDPATAFGVGSTAIHKLERLRASGAGYLVVPRHQLGRLAGACSDLQQHLESRYRALVRDGGSCAIYDLRAG